MIEMPIELPESSKLKPMQHRDQEIPDAIWPATNFSREQISALHALGSGMTPTEAADHIGIHRSQLYRWAKQPAYSHALSNAQREHYAAVAVSFHTLAKKALAALEQILDDPKAAPNARIKTAAIIFDRLERAQPAMPRTNAELLAIDEQCRDENAPHLVVGRAVEYVTDRDAKSLPTLASGEQIVTQIQVELPVGSENVTDRDAESAPVQPIATAPAEDNVTDRDAESTPVQPIATAPAEDNVTDRDAESAPVQPVAAAPPEDNVTDRDAEFTLQPPACDSAIPTQLATPPPFAMLAYEHELTTM